MRGESKKVTGLSETYALRVLFVYNDSIDVGAVSKADVLCPRRIQGAGGKFVIRICSIIVTAIDYMAS